MKINNLLSTLLLFTSLSCNFAYSQIEYLEKEWQNDYGINLPDERSDFEIDNYGNLVFLSKDNSDIKLSCVNTNGNLIWQQTVNNQVGDKTGIDVEIASDNSIIFLIQINTSTNTTLNLQKYSTSGSLVWQTNEVMPLNSKGTKVRILNNDVHVLASKPVSGNQRLFFLKKNLSNGTGTSSFTQITPENASFNPIDFIYDNTGKIIILSHKTNLTTGYSHLTKLGTNLNQLSSQVIETTPGNHIPTSIRSYLSFCVVGGQADINGKFASINVFNLNSLNSMGSGLNDLPNSIYKDFEVINDQVYATGYFVDSLGQNRIFVESATLVGQTGWRKIISSPINDIDFEGIDLIPNGNSKIYVIAKGAIDITQAEDWLVYEFNNLGDLTNKFFMDRTSQSDVNSKILATPNGLYVSGQTKDGTNPKSSLVKIRTASTDTIPNVDGEIEPLYYGFIKNYGQLKSYNYPTEPAKGINYYSSSPKYMDALSYDKLSFIQTHLVDTIQKLYDVNRSDLLFINGNLSKQIERSPNDLKRNYYLTNSNKGIVGVEEFGNIHIPQLYPNIDLKINHNSSGIKLTFAKNFKGELSDIELNWNGVTNFQIVNDKLLVTTPIDVIDFEQPIAYQYSNSNTLVQFTANYVINSSGNITIEVIGYNPSNTLFIVMKDGNHSGPTEKLLGDNMEWSTYFGMNGYTSSRDVSTDQLGNSHFCGETNSALIIDLPGFFPNANYYAGTDAFVVKFNQNIVPQWYTFYGGAIPNGPVPATNPEDIATAIAVQTDGNRVYFTGNTRSTDLLMLNALGTGYTGDQTNSCNGLGTECWDIFVARLNWDGILIWSTYYGEADFETASDIQISRIGIDKIYVVGGRSSSTNLFPMAGATNTSAGKGLLLQFNSADNLEWANGWDCERITSVHADQGSNVYIGGYTMSSSMPTLNTPAAISQTQSFNGGNYDGFIARYNSFSNVLTHSMYYGGNCGDFISGIDSDISGNIYVIGKTGYPEPGVTYCSGSINLPVIGNGFGIPPSAINQLNHFIFKTGPFLNNTPINILHAGYFGGGGEEQDVNKLENGVSWAEASISVSNSGICSISGTTNSSSVYSPVIPMPSVQPLDFFVQNDRDLHVSNESAHDAYIAVFDANFELKYSTYFGHGLQEDGAASISYSEFDNRLYFAGNSSSLNNVNCSAADEFLILEEYNDAAGSNDFYYEDLTATPGPEQPTWFAMFSLDGLEIPDTGTASINDIDSYFSVYPNPSNDILNVVSEENEFTIELYDLAGKKILMYNSDSNSASIKIEYLKTGTYILTYNSISGSSTKKIVKL